MLPRRLEVRFALEAVFLVLLALGAGLAGLRPLYIVVVMAVAWLLVALAELTAERIERSPLTYLLPSAEPVEQEEEEEHEIFGPRPEERTVVAPPSRVSEPEPEPEPEPEREPEPEPEPEEPEPPAEKEETLTPSLGGRLRARLRKREPEPEPEPSSQPRHVKLLPRRSAPEPSRASQEVAELFGASSDDEDGKQEEAKQ